MGSNKRTTIVLAAALFLTGCSTASVIRIDQGGPQKHLAEMERRLHADSQQLEQKLATQGALYEDPAVTAYLQQLAQKLKPPADSQGTLTYDFRIVRDPTVNAYALPNGRTYYHLGLITPMRNPDMLAGVMAHELSHVIHRDSLYLLDDFHQKTVAAKIAQIPILTGAALFGVADLANLTLNVIYASSVTGYGREKETRADLNALEQLHAAGMNPAGVRQMLEVLLKEGERYQQGAEIWFLMNHPSNEKRVADATAWLEKADLSQTAPEDDAAFLKLTDPLRLETASLNLKYERYFHALDILEALSKRRVRDPAVLTLQAECYRRLAEDQKAAQLELNSTAWSKIRLKSAQAWKDEWFNKAADAFSAAMQADPAYPETHRGLGFLHTARGESEQAIAKFESYLELKPDAKDKRYINSQLERLRKQQPPLPKGGT